MCSQVMGEGRWTDGLLQSLLGPKCLFLPWLVQSCCQCQPDFRNHWRRHGETYKLRRRRRRSPKSALLLPSRCSLPDSPACTPPRAPGTCDSRGSGGGGFCPSPGGVTVAAQVPPGPGGKEVPMPLGWGMTPEGSMGKTRSPFSGVPLVPSRPLVSHTTIPRTSQRPLAGTFLR